MTEPGVDGTGSWSLPGMGSWARVLGMSELEEGPQGADREEDE